MRTALLLPVIMIFVCSFATRTDTLTTIRGTVIAQDTGKPIQGALVYVVAGEEEALTKEKGEFRITTAKKTPLTVTTEHQLYKHTTVTVTDASQPIIIRMKAK